MTAYEIINKGFGLAGETFDRFPDKDLPLIWLNVSAGESVEAENAIRAKRGMPLLENHPVIKDQSDPVDMAEQICAVALPYAVAGYLCADREDNYLAAIFRNRFITALQNAAKCCEQSVVDVYGGEE